MRHDVVGRVQPLALEAIGDHRDRAVVLVAHDAAGQVLARKLPALEVERVAVAVVRRHAKDAHAAVVLEPAHLPVVRDVAPHQITSDAAPRRPLGPQRARPQALDRRVRLTQAVEQRIDRQHVGIGEIDVRRRVRPEVARWRRDRARRCHRRRRLRRGEARPECDGTRGDTGRLDQHAPRYQVRVVSMRASLAITDLLVGVRSPGRFRAATRRAHDI